MSYSFSPLPNWQLSDGNGKPYAGGLIYTYESGSTTPKATYDDDDVANTNPVVLDSEGRATVKLESGKYRMVLTDGFGAVLFDPSVIEGVTIWDIDNIGNDNQNISTTNTMNGLKAIPLANIADGDAVILQGYMTVGDGGGGLFVWNATSTDTNDGGVVVMPSDGSTGRWIRQFNGGVNPRWWGAVGNGSADDTTAMTSAKTYAVAKGCSIALDYGTFYCATNPGFTTTSPIVVFNSAIIKWTGYALNINPSIPISDTNRHFNYPASSGYDPIFPTHADIRYLWLDGTTTAPAWYQTTFGLATDVSSLQASVANLKGAINDIVIINDGAGTWTAGNLVVDVNNDSYTQTYDSTSKDTSMVAMAAKIQASTSVATAVYSSTRHQIVITPESGETLYVMVDASGVTGGLSSTITLEKCSQYAISTTQRIKEKNGSTVTATNNLIVGQGNTFLVSGTTTINLISNVGWETGSKFSLYFDTDFPLIKHNQTLSGDYKPISLLDAIDYTPEVNTVITFFYNGSRWIEVNRNTLRQMPTITGNVNISGRMTSNDLITGNMLTTDHQMFGTLTLSAIGNGIKIKEGTNGTMGTGTLSGGTLTILNTKVTASSRIFLQSYTANTVRVSSKSAGVSFTVSGTGTDSFDWLLVEPA